MVQRQVRDGETMIDIKPEDPNAASQYVIAQIWGHRESGRAVVLAKALVERRRRRPSRSASAIRDT